MCRTRVDECYPGPMGAAPRRLVDKAGSGRSRTDQRPLDVGDLECQVVDPLSADGQKAVQGACCGQGFHEFDPYFFDRDERDPDVLLIERLPPDLGKPKALIEGSGSGEAVDED